MYWHRVVERLGRSSLVGTTVRDAARLPTHLVADEHYADWAGKKGYAATTVGSGCVLWGALTAISERPTASSRPRRGSPNPITLPKRSTQTAGR
ncbi:hypothetical protein [Singulisphaera acidiphila]|uniref:hypothetical protein n=1 Tax=Singulisphaera acidiphila TaxID=466153 RepID=UPI001FD13340|nr:hypothetical protein [Singulisphaera acidiphila]